MKKYFYVFFIVLLIVGQGVLFAGAEKEKSDVTTLKLIIPWINEELDGFLPVIEEFEAENPNIKVVHQTLKPEDVSTILSVQFESQRTPADVIDTSFAWYIKQQGSRGHLLSLNDLFEDSEFVKGAFDEVSVNGMKYGVAGVGGITVPEYRKSYFASKNIPSPQQFTGSVKEFLDMLREKTGITEVLASGGGVGWTFTSIVETWILTFGGREMHTQLREGTLSWTDPSVRKIFTDELLPLIRDGYFGEPDEYEALLKSMWGGKHVIFVGDSTDSQIIHPPTDRGVFLFPGQDTVMLWNDYWFIPKYTEHPEEAKKLIRFLATRGQQIQVSNGGRIGTYLNIDTAVYPESEKDIFALLNTVSVVPDLDDSIGGKFQSTIWDQLALLWARPDIQTLDSLLENLQKASEETFASK